MKKMNRKAAVMAIAVLMGGGSVLSFQSTAAAAQETAMGSDAVRQAIAQLVSQGVLHGAGEGHMQEERHVTNAEAVKMIVLALGLKPSQEAAAQPSEPWYTAYVNTAAAHKLLEDSSKFLPNQPADPSELAAMIAKALQRDVKSVQYWMKGLQIGQEKHISRGDTARLLVAAEKAVRSEHAQIVSVKALNKIAFEVTFDRPLTLADEALAAAQANFIFEPGIKLVNQPRLKTGSFATYIVPVQTMQPDHEYTLTYKGQQTFRVASSGEMIQLKSTRQVTNDTFEVDSFRADGVIDYGYVISAYAGGRGANAAVLEEDNTLQGQAMQIIPSLAARQATLTPEGGQPVTVNYVGFTQSTDGRQEPKFRLPAGTALQPGVKYTVASDWFELENNTFVAEQIEPLQIASVSQTDERIVAVTLSADPGDELFAYRSIELKGSDGTVLTAQYRVQTRKGDTGMFDIQNDGRLASCVTYEVVPVGTWAAADRVKLTAK
ncbi:hypothetical protein J2T17_002733 [Paenibacillus mucilaginosus]|uniref:S-layer homology domain-containing protein n=1 Tax=Paenibacillus mucilaginosus TaxID=61624 RepID=UPI003D1C60E7